MTRESGRHAPRWVEVNLDKVFEVVRHTNQSAVVDGVRDIGQLQLLLVTSTNFKITKSNFFWFAEESLALLREKKRVQVRFSLHVHVQSQSRIVVDFVP